MRFSELELYEKYQAAYRGLGAPKTFEQWKASLEKCEAELDRLNASPAKFSEAADFCREAARLVSIDRRPENTDNMINFRTTALLWEAYLEAKVAAGEGPITPKDVADMQELFKMGRGLGVPYNPDNYVDRAGYAGCAGELANGKT